ncbi:uncharacterized protein LOC121467954 [Drosophila elegans]|uniref:uncharacterized protein LOC121467954 n=1 Tax=Drosophila elegans TaxID=30023 RepID=UPI001BC84FA6|nr:uncharacterized protein LOC121467954 [Drosophila elegans]
MCKLNLAWTLGIVLTAMVSGTTRTTTREPTTIESIVIRAPTPRPLCIRPPQCIPHSPRVCGRFPNGDCQRFANICTLLALNRHRNPLQVVHTRELDCRGIRAVGAENRRPCYHPCPARPVACKRTPPAEEICVRSRNLQSCKLLANNCQLLNQNCHARPRNNWHRTDKRRCGNRMVGDKPDVCEKLPVVVTSRPRPRNT